MAQITVGLCQVVNGSTTVVAFPDVDWTVAQSEILGGKRVWFKIDSGGAPIYDVTAITFDGGTNLWNATISPPYGEASDANADYILNYNFTPNLGLPIPNPDDVGVADFLARAFAIIDTDSATWAGGGGMLNPMTRKGDLIVGNTGTTASPASPSTPTQLPAGTSGYVLTSGGPDTLPSWAAGAGGGSDPGQQWHTATYTAGTGLASPQDSTHHRHIEEMILNAGASSAYTVNFYMPSTSRISGDQCQVVMSFAASTTNPATVTLRSLTSGGTILWQWTNDGVGRKAWANFVYDSVAALWKLQNSGFVS
jgi:hypothetical protein